MKICHDRCLNSNQLREPSTGRVGAPHFLCLGILSLKLSRALSLLTMALMLLQAQAQGYKLLTTFTNPAPANLDSFGESMAPFGNDQILIGTYSEEQNTPGKAYLYQADGTLLTTFSNPHPSGDYFGLSI